MFAPVVALTSDADVVPEAEGCDDTDSNVFDEAEEPARDVESVVKASDELDVLGDVAVGSAAWLDSEVGPTEELVGDGTAEEVEVSVERFMVNLSDMLPESPSTDYHIILIR